MINNKISTKDKLDLVYKFYKEVWNSNILTDKRPEPPTPEQMLKNIHTSTLPGIELLTLENHWEKARMFFYMAGDETMLHMDGDLTEEEIKNYLKMIDEKEDMDADRN